MNEHVAVEGRIVSMVWGKKTYTVLPWPDDVRDALGAPRRAEGAIIEHPVNLAVTRAPVIDRPAFLHTRAALLAQIGITPGAEVELRLRPARYDDLGAPADISAALRAAGHSSNRDAWTPGRRSGALHRVERAKRAEPRGGRITAPLGELRK